MRGHVFQAGWCVRCNEPDRPMSIEKKTASLALASGIEFFPFDPCIADIHIDDIAHGTAGINRYAGHHHGGHYSVAEHSYNVALQLGKRHRLWGILHDAAEGLGFNDINTHVKRCLPDYKDGENNCMRCVVKAFRLNPDIEPREVKEADMRMLVTEQLQIEPNVPWLRERIRSRGIAPYPDVRIHCWSHLKARTEFLGLFEELLAEHKKYYGMA